MVTRATIDNTLCETLILRSAEGDGTACHALVDYLWPIWLEMIRSNPRMQCLDNRDDASHDVATRLVEKLGQPQSRALRLYLPWKQSNPEKAFEDWLRIITQNVIRDYRRGKVEHQHSNTHETSVKRLLNDFTSSPVADELGHRPAITLAQTARELLDFAKQRLSPSQLIVLESWLMGESFEEIASHEDITIEAARQSVRSAVAVLRRHFSSDDPNH